MKARSCLLLLVPAHKNSSFITQARKVHNVQGSPTKMISGTEYYQLQLSLSNVSNNPMATMGKTELYTMNQFKTDVTDGHQGFDVAFGGCDTAHNFTWKQIVREPKSFLFFGPPLPMNRLYDKIFKDIKVLEALHHQFVHYYDHFVGDVKA